jgi:hypothetical protein
LNRQFAARSISTLEKRFFPSLGLGVLLIILFPVASLIAFISFIGWPLGFLISFAFGTFCFAGSIYVAQFLGCYIIRVLNMGKKPLSFVGLLLGIIILSLLVLIPFVGWIVCILVMASGLGSLVLSLKIFSDNKQSQPASGESLPNE